MTADRARDGEARDDGGWFGRPMRWAQLTLVENDPAHYDPAFWIDYFRRTHSDAACLSAGGCVAYYPTEIPLHHRSAWMQEGDDPFGDLVAGCRQLGMIVIARTDPHAVRQDVYDAHPDWIAVDAEGNPRRHWSRPDLWVTCALGPYNFEFMTEVHREIMRLYGIEGVFSNRWAGHGICYCAHCQRNFCEATGYDLPRTEDPQDPARQAYILWRQERLFDLWQLWDAAIREINPDARYIPNSGGGALSSLNMRRIGEQAEILFADRQARRGLMPPWAAGKNAKEYRATMGHKPVGGIFSVGVEEEYRWKDSVQNEPEVRLWVADATANGLRPWFTKFSGTLHDHRWLPVVESIYNWNHRVEGYLRNTENLARVAMVYSQQTAWFYGGPEARAKVEDHTLGLYHALIEARIPFEMVHDELLGAEHVDRFKTLILPNIAALSDAQCQQLSDYVGRGGSLFVTHETSLYDERGRQRDDFGLADLLGVSFKGQVEGPIKNSYLNLEHDAENDAAQTLLRGLQEAERIINGVYRVHVEPTAAFDDPALTLVPSYPDLPMEEVYPRFPHTDIAEIYMREFASGGRVVYFPWDIDRIFWEILNVDHGLLMRNAVEWATNEARPVTVEGPGVLDVTIWRQENSLTVHLVNLTNPMMLKGPLRTFMPVGEQRVRIRLPEGEAPRRVHLLRHGERPEWQEREGYLEVVVPTVVDHEVVAVDL